MEKDDDRELSELDAESREILTVAIEWQEHLVRESNDDHDKDNTNDDDSNDDTSWRSFLLKHESPNITALRNDMIEHCRKWREMEEDINKDCDEGRMGEFEAINAGSDLRRMRSRKYHEWRLRSMGMAKRRIIGTAEEYDNLLRAVGGEHKRGSGDASSDE